MTGSGLTASHVAVALVASARLRGLDAAGIFDSGYANRKARVLAAASLGARLGVKKTVLAKLFQLHPQELSPSMLAHAEVSAEAMLEVAEALCASGLSLAPERACPQSEAAPAVPARKARKADAAAKPERVEPVARIAPAAPRVIAATEAPPAPARVSRPRKVSVAGGSVARLKPVTPAIARWGGFFLEAGWDADEAADLFDVSPEALIDALDPASVEARA